MPKPRDVPGESALDLAFPLFNANFALQACEPLVAGMVELGAKACTNWMDMNRQWTAFLAQRFQEDVALVHNLANAPIHRMSTTSIHYQREFTEMMKLGQTSFAEATTATQKAIEVSARETMRPAA